MTAEVFWMVFPLWFRAFLFTLAVEIPLFVFLARRQISPPIRLSLKRLVFAAASGTLVTHPLLWFVWPLVVRDYVYYIASGELLIAAIESVTFYLLARPIRFTRALVTSVVANGASFILGFLLHSL